MFSLVVESCVRRQLAIAVLGFAAFAALTLPPPAAAQAAPYLSGKDVRESILGKTFTSKSKSGKPYTMNLGSDGTGLIVFANGAVKDPVTWEITGDVLCFHGTRSGNECNRIRPAGGQFDFVDSSTGILNNIYAPR